MHNLNEFKSSFSVRLHKCCIVKIKRKTESYNMHSNKRQLELVHKKVRLQVLQDLKIKNGIIVQQKMMLFEIGTRELDKIQKEVWDLQNQQCDQSWNFSMKHKHISILNELPNFPKEFPFTCFCSDRSVEKERRINPQIQELSKEIEKLETTFEIENNCMLKSDLTKAQLQLHITSEENSQIKILQTSLAATEKRICALKKKIQEKYNIKNISDTFLKSEEFNYNLLHKSANSNFLEVKKMNIDSGKSQLPYKLADQGYKENHNEFLLANNRIEKSEEQNKLDKTLKKTISIVGGNIQSKKTFVFKTRSLLTQRSKH